MNKHKPKVERNILVALLLNVTFAIAEFIGGIFTNSVAILTDAIHDSGDAISIALSYFLERKSKHRPDDKHTFGYKRYSTLGALITTIVLIASASLMIIAAIQRIFNPSAVNSDGMLIFAILGIIVNGIALFVTRKKGSTNQKAVNLHMLDDVLGWVVVLAGSLIIKFTGCYVIDPLMSLGVSVFIIISAAKNLKPIMTVFLDKVPDNISTENVKFQILTIEGVDKIRHIHVWAADEHNCYAMVHVTAKPTSDVAAIRTQIKDMFKAQGITQSVIEVEIRDK